MTQKTSLILWTNNEAYHQITTIRFFCSLFLLYVCVCVAM